MFSQCRRVASYVQSFVSHKLACSLNRRVIRRFEVNATISAFFGAEVPQPNQGAYRDIQRPVRLAANSLRRRDDLGCRAGDCKPFTRRLAIEPA